MTETQRWKLLEERVQRKRQEFGWHHTTSLELTLGLGLPVLIATVLWSLVQGFQISLEPVFWVLGGE